MKNYLPIGLWNTVVRTPVATAFAVALLFVFVTILLTPVTSDTGTFDRPGAKNDSAPIVPVFSDRTLDAGIFFSHLQGDEHLTGLDEVIGPGACVLDYDNDGWMDLFLVNGTGQTRFFGSQYWWHVAEGHRLYRNTRDGRFEDVTKKAGLSYQSRGMGCAAGDLDNDGNVDLLITNNGGNLLYRNDGNGTFRNVTRAAGLRGSEWSTSAALADFDGDGLLDIYITNYLNFRKGAKTFEGGSQYDVVSNAEFNARLFPGVANVLYRNAGSFQFQDVTAKAGVADASGRGLAALWADINQDRKPDLLVLNDTGFANSLFVNRGDGSFAEAGERFRLNDARGTRAARLTDMDHDGHFDIVIGTVAGFPNQVLVPSTTPGDTGLFAFYDRARQLGIAREEYADSDTWGLAIGDYNNDGNLDLLTGNGLVQPDSDVNKVPQGQQRHLWLGSATGFAASRGMGDSADVLAARGAVTADFDNDGRMDVYLTQNNGLGQLLHNDSANGNHWLGVVLTDVHDNRSAVGAKVTVKAGARGQTQWMSLSGSMSGNDPRLLFGLGKRKHADLTVEWPDGAINTYRRIEVDRYLYIARGRDIGPIKASPANKPNGSVTTTLSIGAIDAANRIDYLHWRIKAKGLPLALPSLRAAAHDPDARVRQALAVLLRDHRAPATLALATDLSHDRDANVRREAVRTVSVFENEHAVRWLLLRFGDEDAGVRAAVARVFEYYYREEEAVVYRKFLALPYLIGLLQDKDTAVRIAAADALGEAERYRAVKPLVNLLDDKTIKVRVAAVRALGKIREREAIKSIVAQYRRRGESPLVRAQCLIALKRLNAHEYDLLWQRLGSARNTASQQTDWQTLDAILADHENGIVIPRHSIESLILRRLRALVPESLNKEFADTVVSVLEHGTGTRGRLFLRKFTARGEPGTRARAWSALLRTAPEGRSNDALAALNDANADVRMAAMSEIVKRHVRLPRSTIKQLLAHRATRAAAASLIAVQPKAVDLRLLEKLAWEPKEKHEVRATALDGLAGRPGTGVKRNVAPELYRLLSSKDAKLRHAALNYILHSPRPDERQAFHQWLGDTKVMPALRREGLLGLVRTKRPGSTTVIWKLARLRHDPLSLDALAALGDLPDGRQDNYLWTVLRNTGEPEKVRFAAARGLVTRHTAEVVAALTK
jgi:HEAT repeat protein